MTCSLYFSYQRPYCFPLIINICSVVLEGLPRHWAMVLPFYSKLLVQFQELVEIIDVKCPSAY